MLGLQKINMNIGSHIFLRQKIFFYHLLPTNNNHFSRENFNYIMNFIIITYLTRIPWSEPYLRDDLKNTYINSLKKNVSFSWINFAPSMEIFSIHETKSTTQI